MIRHQCVRHLLGLGILITFGVGALLPFSRSSTVIAQNGNISSSATIVINEILANAKNESSGESIELWNVTDTPIDIGGWTLGDAGDGNDVIGDFQPTWDRFAQGTQIPPYGFAVIVDPDAKEGDHPWINDREASEAIIVVTIGGDATIGNGMTNAGDDIFVRNGTAEIDHVSWTSDAGDGKSWERTSASDNTWSRSGADLGSSLGRGNNDAPIALFQCDIHDATVGQRVTCDASLSSDPEQSPLIYSWKVGDLLQPEQSHSNFSFTPTLPGEISIGLIVNDGNVDAIAESERIIVGAPPSYSNEIEISELFVNAIGEDGGKEWIELINTSATDIHLAGWLLDDGQGGSMPYRFPEETWIRAHSMLVVPDTTSRLILNNGQDAVRLSSPDDTIASEVTYQSAPENQSWARMDSLWNWTTITTPGSTNIMRTATPDIDDSVSEPAASEKSSASTTKSKAPLAPVKEVLDLRELQTLAMGTRVQFIATVYALPGVISTTRIVVLRHNVPVEVSMVSANFPEGLVEDDVIDVTGIIKRSRGQRYIETKEADVTIIPSLPDESPFVVSLQSIVDDTYRSMQLNTPIEAHGQVVEIGTTSFKLQLPSARITIGSKSLLQDELPPLGAMATVTGLLRKRGSSIGAELRSSADITIEDTLHPSQLDNPIVQKPVLPPWFSWLIIGIIVCIAITTMWTIHAMKKRVQMKNKQYPVDIA